MRELPKGLKVGLNATETGGSQALPAYEKVLYQCIDWFYGTSGVKLRKIFCKEVKSSSRLIYFDNCGRERRAL